MAGEMGTNLTRRDALRRGTLLGAGVVWAAPAVRTMTMSSNFAAATSPVVDDNQVEVTTTEAADVEGIVVTQPGTPQVTSGAAQVSGGQLPFTGIEAGEAALLGAGMLAVGAAIVSATKQDRQTAEPSE